MLSLIARSQQLQDFFIMANVRLEGIKRRFNNVTAIEDITFTVPDGQFWV